MTDRKIKNDEVSDTGRGHHRQAPDDLDWARRYLDIKLVDDRDGAKLQQKMESLDSDAWRRFKNAARQHKMKTSGDFAVMLNRSAIDGKHMGFLWKRIIAAGLCNEEDVLTYCENGTGMFADTRWSDAGCRAFFRDALHAAASTAKDDGSNYASNVAAIDKYVEKVRADKGDAAAEAERIKMMVTL